MQQREVLAFLDSSNMCVLYKEGVLKKFAVIQEKPVLFESLFDKFACLQIPEDSIGFPVNTAKF